MRTMLLATTLGVALAACGGGGARFRDPAAATFEYGPEQTPTALEASAAVQAAGAALGTTSLASAAGTSAAPAGSYAGATSSLTASGLLPGGAAFGSPAELDGDTISRIGTALLQRGLAADWSRDCWTATPSRVQFDACPLPIDATGSGPLTGSLTLRGPFDLAPGQATWAATVDIALEAAEARAAGFEDLKGSIAWTETSLSGHARVDVSMNVTSYGQGNPAGGLQGWHEWHQLWRGVTYDATYDLTYAAASVCASRVTGGTIIVKRLWTVAPPMATDGAFTDASVRFTWSGCGDVSGNLTVARSWGAS